MMLQNGEKIGQYEIVAPLGQGGMANVYKAYHDRLDRHVAVKVMHQSMLQDDNFLNRFQREARIVAKLEHPNIVPVYDYSEHNGIPYLIMKYIEGPTLKRYSLKVGLTLEQTASLMTELALALDYAHSRDVLHRDMKPSNILIDMQGKPYITDFGLARIVQAGSSTISSDMMLGTPYYISPEQAKGEKDLNGRTDIYSFGVILYELITGAIPFVADTPYAIVHAHIYQPPPAPRERNPDLPAALDPVILRALAKNPAERYPTASALMVAFNAALTATPLDIPVEKSSEPIRPVETQAAPASTNVIAAPVAHRPPADVAQEEKRTITDSKGKKVEIEGALDLGSLAQQLSKVDWSKVGEEMKNRVEGFASYVEARIDTELKQRGYELDEAGAEEAKVRKLVEKRLKERQELAGHIVTYLMVNAFLIMIWFFTTGLFSFPWWIFPAGGWGIGVIAHIADYSTKYGKQSQRHRDRIEAEVREELAARGEISSAKSKNTAKAKNEDRLSLESAAPPSIRLNEDGEMTDSFIDELQDHEQRRQRR
jgi:serine/threonine-protein kinase